MSQKLLFYFPNTILLLCKKAENGQKKRRKTIGGETCKYPVTNRLLWPIKHKHRVQLVLFKCLNLFPHSSFASAMPEWCVDHESSQSFLTCLPHLEKRVTSTAPVSENCCPRKNTDKSEKNKQGRRLTLSGPGNLQRARQVACLDRMTDEQISPYLPYYAIIFPKSKAHFSPLSGV